MTSGHSANTSDGSQDLEIVRPEAGPNLALTVLQQHMCVWDVRETIIDPDCTSHHPQPLSNLQVGGQRL